VLDGKAPASEYSPIRLVVPDDGATKWHSYTIAGTYGLLSKPVIDLIGRYMVAWFDFLDAWINDVPFFFLRKKAVLDCLDRKNSVLVPFSGEPGTIKRIDRYRFFKEKIPDPAVFPIPEIRYHLFATNSIKTKVEGAKLKGLHFQDAEHGIGP
jgi:hypothetical protein